MTYFIHLITFFFVGIGLAFSPCVLPMVPIITASVTANSTKPIVSGCLYVLGMATSYAVMGLITVTVGMSLTPLLRGIGLPYLFSFILVILAGSLFNWYSFAHSVENWGLFKAHSSFLLGVFSTLVVSPCITGPLMAILTYIDATGKVVLGGLELFTLGVGMGIPMLLFSVSLGHLLPKCGQWLQWVEKGMGVGILGMAVWVLL